MLEYDKNKIPQAVEVAEELRDIESENDNDGTLISSLDYLIKSLSDNDLNHYGLGSTLQLTVFSLSDALIDNPYDYFVNLVEKHHGPLDGKKIVEVAAGIYPIVSSKLLERHPNIDRIDVYDPMLIHNESLDSRIHFHRCVINYFTQIDPDALVISMQPCGATFMLLDLIRKYKLNSVVMLCTCNDALMCEYIDGPGFVWYDHVKHDIKKEECDYFEVGIGDTKYKSRVAVPYFYTKRRYVDDEDAKDKDNPVLKKTDES